MEGRLKRQGRVPSEVPVEEAQEEARQALLNALSLLEQHLGTLNAVAQVVRLEGFVASDPSFGEQPRVLNGASELLKELFGPRGEHTRLAIGAAALPLGAVVEIALWVEVSPPA